MQDWDACLALAPPRSLSGILLRLVESQEQVATSRLVGSLERQEVLEELLERTKPRTRPGAERLHYLLATPFRYPPLPWGSRFGSRAEPSLFYGAHDTTTLLWEAAYYRLLFWHGMVVPPARKLASQHTLFAASYRTERGLCLQDEPFAAHRAVLSAPADYRASQALGGAMRRAGIEAFEYQSARDPEGGLNVALFTPLAFALPAPLRQEAWLGEVDAERVRFRAVHGGSALVFELGRFLVDGRLPQPA